MCYTSVLKRAMQTVWHCLDAMERTWLPVVHFWRRGYDTRPPALTPADRRKIQDDPRYATLCPWEIPHSESMRDAVMRVQSVWQDAIEPCVASGKRVLIVAHGTTIRAFVGFLGGLSEAEVEQLEVPNGMPLVYELDAHLRPALTLSGPRYRFEDSQVGRMLPALVSGVRRCQCRIWRRLRRRRRHLQKFPSLKLPISVLGSLAAC